MDFQEMYTGGDKLLYFIIHVLIAIGNIVLWSLSIVGRACTNLFIHIVSIITSWNLLLRSVVVIPFKLLRAITNLISINLKKRRQKTENKK